MYFCNTKNILPLCQLDKGGKAKNTPKSYFMEENTKKAKPGRPVKPNKKDTFVTLRLSQEEASRFKDIFKRSRESTKSKFIKKCIFGKQINAPEMPLITYYNSIAEIAKELNKSGNNINQITKKINTMNLSEKELRLVSYELNRIMEELIFTRQLSSKVTDYLAEFREKYMK